GRTSAGGENNEAVSRSVAARLFHHPADAEVSESDCPTRVRRADAEGIAAPGSQTRSRKLPLGCRSDRFLARASLRKIHPGGIRRSAHQIAASPLFGRIEPARFSESSAPDCRCCAV